MPPRFESAAADAAHERHNAVRAAKLVGGLLAASALAPEVAASLSRGKERDVPAHVSKDHSVTPSAPESPEMSASAPRKE